MVAFAVDYGFETSLSPTSVAAGFSASALSDVGAGSVTWNAAQEARFVPGITFDGTDESRFLTFTIGPTDAGQAWTPQAFTLRAKRLHTSTTQGFKVRTSADGFASPVYSFTGLTGSYVTHTIDLSSVGEITGTLEVRIKAWAGSTTSYLQFDDLHVEGVYTPAGAADQNVAPGGIASAEAFGGAAIVVVQPVDLSPAGIASGEAFGAPEVLVVAPIPDLEIGVGGIGSAEGFGLPTVREQTPGTLAYPSGQDVAAFMGTEDPKVVAVATIHVGVITQFALVYTRGNGFYVDGLAEPLAGVVLAATARLVGNPEQLDIQVGSVRRASFFKGWSLAEQRVLNNYRGVAT